MSKPVKQSIKTLKRQFSPDVNPLLEGTEVSTREKKIFSGKTASLVNVETGEEQAVSAIYQTKEVDEEHFVKVFAEGVKAAYSLQGAGAKVFTAILYEYQKTAMKGGYADSIYLAWFNDGLNGHSIGLHRRTFNRGLAEMIEKKFLAPKSPESYWVNPALFFKGDRVRFIKDYQVKVKKDCQGKDQQVDIEEVTGKP